MGGDFGTPILMAAVTRPLVDKGLGPSVYATVETLLLAGADLTSTDRSGNTVMHAAATGKRTGEWNHPDWRAKLRTHTSSEHLVSLLLFHGGDASARGSWGETPLFSAFSSEVAAVLVEAGADVNARSDGGRTPLHSSITSISTRDVFEYILPLVEDIDAVDCNGFTPLHNAASCNNVFAVRALLQRGANMHLRSVAMELWPRPVLAVECIRVNFKEGGLLREDTRELRDLFAEETHRRGCCEAFAMGLRPRLGVSSVVHTLDDEVIRIVLASAGMLHS
ncbi:ankyrin repeat-containing domain protein, partial [Baffinella frigidus]